MLPCTEMFQIPNVQAQVRRRTVDLLLESVTWGSSKGFTSLMDLAITQENHVFGVRGSLLKCTISEDNMNRLVESSLAVHDLLTRIVDPLHKSKIHSIGLQDMTKVVSHMDANQKKYVPETLHAIRHFVSLT